MNKRSVCAGAIGLLAVLATGCPPMNVVFWGEVYLHDPLESVAR